MKPTNIGGRHGSNYGESAKQVAIPMNLSEEGCGNDLLRWQLRESYLRCQQLNIHLSLKQAWVDELTKRTASRGRPPPRVSITAELGRVTHRRSRAVEAIESLSGGV